MGIEEAVGKAKECYEKGKAFSKAEGVIDTAVAAVPYVGAVYSLFKCLMPGEQGPTLGDVMKEVQRLHNELVGLLNELGAKLVEVGRLVDDQELSRDLLAFWNPIQDAYDKAAAWVDSVTNEPPGNPYLWERFLLSIPDMDLSMHCFLPNPVTGSDTYFTRVYVEEFLYHYQQIWDRGKAAMKPDDCPVGDVGRIWDYGWTLPAFLRAIAMRLFVLQLEFPEDYGTGFVGVTDERSNIQQYAKQLWHIHNQIRANIKVIPRPDLRWGLWFDDDECFVGRVCMWKNDLTYGAVECYSGTPLVDTYSLADGPVQPSDHCDDAAWQAYDDQCTPYCERFAWYYDTLSYAKQVQLYYELGLPALWNTINSLRALTLDPPLEASEYAGEPWFNALRGLSLRQIVAFVPESMKTGWVQGEPLSLRQLGAAVGCPAPASLREMLIRNN